MYKEEVKNGDILWDMDSKEYCVVESNGSECKLQYKDDWFWFEDVGNACNYIGNIENSKSLVSEWYNV